MTLLEIFNLVISTTGVGKIADTLTSIGSNSDESLILGFIQDAQFDISRDVPNPSLNFYGNISTVDDVNLEDNLTTSTSNNLVKTNGSCEISGTTGNVLVPLSIWKGRLLHVTGDSQVYRVRNVFTASTAHVGGTVQLADMSGDVVNYRGTTVGTTASSSGFNCKVAQDRYLLPKNFKRPIHIQDFFTPQKMEFIAPEDFDTAKFDIKGSRFELGRPRRFTIFETVVEDGVPRFYIEFDPIPDDVYHFPFRYEGSPKEMVFDDDVTGYPREYEMAIIFRSRYYVYRYIKKNNTDAQAELAEYKRVVDDQGKSDIAGRSFVRLQPHTGRRHFADAYGAHDPDDIWRRQNGPDISRSSP